MKSLKTITAVAFMLFLGISNVEAQKSTTITTFTTEQQKLVQEQRDLMTANREAFKASLTAEQQAILNDPSLNKQQQHAALVKTFTEAQKAILTENRESAKALKKEFVNALTTEQRQQIRAQNGTKISETAKESKGRNVRRN
ncbi:hypothetical protein [Flavobacterium granuli]|uniref:LTXXQ motif family protein n=1 Tax=Flavobacterium granuli TaxID=280093 RepID=A0A1M5NV93_9FLAO|nr:hypothetical protein [Flavobacterium granuli]PRZ23409.1 hypothetical protein BC624_105131 [Flavobacterium granuli]SHG93427.1 hypothetical protein SAMN05443373_105131 [Flavobacterium granuli]